MFHIGALVEDIRLFIGSRFSGKWMFNITWTIIHDVSWKGKWFYKQNKLFDFDFFFFLFRVILTNKS